MPKVSNKTRKTQGTKTKSKGGKSEDRKPKRALSAYMFFSTDWRERIKAENQDANFGEIGRLLGAKWKELDEEDKKPYNEQAAKDKQRAEEEKATFDKSRNAKASPVDGEEEDE